jgi:hypothetical protein
VRHSEGSNWECLAKRRKIAGICALYKGYTGGREWKEIGDRLQGQRYLSRVDHKWKFRARRQRTDVGKYSFVNRTIADWKQLAEGVIWDYNGTSLILRKSIRRVLTSKGK